jgi:hypothetical protein
MISLIVYMFDKINRIIFYPQTFNVVPFLIMKLESGSKLNQGILSLLNTIKSQPGAEKLFHVNQLNTVLDKLKDEIESLPYIQTLWI